MAWSRCDRPGQHKIGKLQAVHVDTGTDGELSAGDEQAICTSTP
jgi:hypothetical protein